MNLANVLKIDSHNIDINKIKKAAILLNSGGLVAFPTETVYGIGANAYDKAAIDNIFAVKNRPYSDPVIVHIYNADHLTDVALDIPDLAYKLVEKYWPGPLTVILKRNDNIPGNVSCGLDTVAVRVPNHSIALALLKYANVPIAAPSANLFSRPSSTSAEHVVADFGRKIDLIIDGGISSIGIESTVIDLTKKKPKVLRPGGVEFELLKELVPDIQLGSSYLAKSVVSSSPGLMLKHYSPLAKLLLFTGDNRDKVLAHMLKLSSNFTSEGKKVGILTVEDDKNIFADHGLHIYSLGDGSKIEHIARSLYDGIRTLDNFNLDVILVRSISNHGLGLAIFDRLYRAAEGTIIKL